MLVRGEPDPDMTFQGQGCCRSCGQAVDDNYIIVRRARPSVPGKNEFTCPRRKIRYCTCRAGKQRFIGDYSSTTPLQDSSIHIRFRAVFATLQNEECDLVWFGDDQG